MSLERRVMWVEGMFLRQHHFQQQERFLEAALRDRLAALHPFGWGLSRAKVDETALASGRFALEAAEGVMPDGLPFDFPGRDPAPQAVEIDRDAVNQTVYLVAPEARPGQLLGAPPREGGGQVAARYVVEEASVRDNLNEASQPVDLQLGALNLRYEVGDRDRPGFVAMPVGRVAERGTDRNVLLADFIPPALAAEASPVLAGFVKEVATLLDARAATLAGQYSQVGGSGAAAIQEFMLLQLVNAKSCAFNALRDARRHHPETIFREMAELAGALAAFTQEDTRRPPPFPRYDHDNLTATFAPVMEELRRSLAHLGEQKAVRIPLKVNRHQIHYGPVPHPDILESGRLVLIATAAMDGEEFRTLFPRQVSIGSVGEIKSIIGAADRSVRVRPLAHPPQELPRMTGWLYLDLDRQSPGWEDVERSRSIAIHYAARFPELQIQLWGVRE